MVRSNSAVNVRTFGWSPAQVHQCSQREDRREGVGFILISKEGQKKVLQRERVVG